MRAREGILLQVPGMLGNIRTGGGGQEGQEGLRERRRQKGIRGRGGIRGDAAPAPSASNLRSACLLCALSKQLCPHSPCLWVVTALQLLPLPP